MVDQPDNLVLEMLRAIRAKQDEHSRSFEDVKRRMTAVEHAIRTDRRESLDAEEAIAVLREEMEILRARIERVDQRLGLGD